MSGKRATPENIVIQDTLLRTRHLVDWMRNNVGVATYGAASVPYGCGGVGGADYLGIVRRTGQFIAVEFKAPGKRPTAAQLRFLRRVRRSGGLAFVAHCAQDVFNALSVDCTGRALPKRKLAA